MSRVATANPLWTMHSTLSLSVPCGAWQRRWSVGQWVLNSLLTQWSLSCSSLSKDGCLSRQRGLVEIASGPAPAILRLGRTWLPASSGGEILLFLPWLARLVGLPDGHVAVDGSPRRTDDGRVVRDFKLEPTTREV